MDPGQESLVTAGDDVLSRRALLRAAGGLGTVAVLAGCGSIDRYEFRADPVVLPARPRDRLGYEETRREPITIERSREVGGVQVQATVESPVAVYERVVESGTDGDTQADASFAGVPDVGVMSTPRGTVLGRSFNPLARLSLANLLTSDIGSGFLRRAGLDRVGEPRRRVQWTRVPAFLAEHEVTCLGTETALDSYAGVLGGDPSTVAFVHLTRVDAESVVVVAAVHGRTVDDEVDAFVGPNGYLQREAFDDVVRTVASVCGALAYVR